MTGNPGPKIGVGSEADAARLLSALEASRAGDYKPLAAVYGTSVDEAKGEMVGLMAAQEGRFGAFRRFEMLGGAMRGARATTWIAFEFERGRPLFEYVWAGPNVTTFRSINGAREFFPESGSGVFSYDLRNGKARRIASELDAGVVKTLILESPAGPVRATREGP